MKKTIKYRAHALWREICSYQEDSETTIKISLCKYKKCLILLYSSHYEKHIYYYADVFNPANTKKLNKLLFSRTSKELFDVISDSFLVSADKSTFCSNFDNYCDTSHIEHESISGFYYYNKENLSYHSFVLSHFRDCFFSKNKDAKPSRLISAKLKSTRNSRIICKYIDKYGDPEHIALFVFKGCLFYVKSTYYNDHIWSDIVGLGRSDTKKLMELLQVENNTQLFSQFMKIFVHNGSEEQSWSDYMDFCDYSNLFKERTNYTYLYNKHKLTFTQFLLHEFSTSHSIFMK